MKLVGDTKLWWKNARIQLVEDGRFEGVLLEIDKAINQGVVVVFTADEGNTWLILRCVSGGLFVELLYSSLAGAVQRNIHNLKSIMRDGGYSRVGFKCFSLARERLFKRHFVCCGDGFYGFR